MPGVTRRVPESSTDPVEAPPVWNRSVADPGPLGLAAFAMTTFVLSCVNAHLIPATTEPVVFGLAFFYGGLAQLLAGMWEFVKGNTFGALAFSSFGAFWLAFWYLASHPSLLSGAGSDASKGVGVFLLGWTIFTAYMTVASLRTSGAVTAVFAFLTITFLLLTIGELGTSMGATKAGGWFGLVTAAVAWYGSFAGVTNATMRRTVLPTFPREP
jgi:succinate-acetate transporter protein